MEYCFKGSTLVPHCLAETVACTRALGTVEGNKKLLKLPVKVHNSKQNLDLLV